MRETERQAEIARFRAHEKRLAESWWLRNWYWFALAGLLVVAAYGLSL